MEQIFTVEILLIRGAVRSDPRNYMSGCDALSIACLHVELFDIVVLLLTHFPGITAQNAQKNTVLHYAPGRMNTELPEKLLAVDLKFLNLSAVNLFGKTAVDYLDEGPMV